MSYTYLGDRFTDPFYKKKYCEAVRDPKGKCIRGNNGNMLVRFENGKVVNVVAGLLLSFFMQLRFLCFQISTTDGHMQIG